MNKKNRKIRHTIIIKSLSAFFFMALLLMHTGVSARCAAEYTARNSTGVQNRSISFDPSGGGYSAVLYNNVNGLPTSEANTIAETGDGFIWIGSYSGLIRYDGNTFERMDSTTGISGVMCLYVDSRDRLWIGTNDTGLFMMEKGEIRKWDKEDGLTSVNIRAVSEDKNGTIYVGTASGLHIINDEMMISTVADTRLQDAFIRDIRVGSDGIIYGITQMGDIFTIKNGKPEFFLEHDLSRISGVIGILPDTERPGYVYLGTEKSQIYHGSLKDNFSFMEVKNISPLSYVEHFEQIDGQLWICAGNGIGYLDGSGFHMLDNVPMDNSVGCVMTDYSGNLWFTSTRQGVMKVVNDQFEDLYESHGLDPAVVNATCILGEKLFIATDYGLTVLEEGKKVEEIPLTKAVTASGKSLHTDDLISFLDGVRLRSIIRDSRDRLWISTWLKYGILCYDKGEVTAFSVDEGLLSERVRVACEFEDGSVAVANTGGVSIIKDNRVIKSYGEESGIENTEILTAAEGYDHNIILGSDGGGIYIIGEKGVKHIGTEEGLNSEIVMRIKRDPYKEMFWIVTSNSIAYMTADYKVTTISNFPYSNNFDLYENSRHQIWILASNGIYVAPKEVLMQNGVIEPVHYSMDNGIPYISTANSYSDLDPDGNLFIAGSAGVAKVNIEKPIASVTGLKAAIPYVEVDGERIMPDGEGNFTIPSNVQKLTIPCFVFNYSLINPQVSYQLQGFEKSGITVDRSALVPVDYTNLKGGTYTFVMSLKDSLNLGSKEISVNIVKIKAFYEETWFFVLSGILILLLIATVVSFYVRKKTQVLERKQRQARELFEQTSGALASAIDAKDAYTNGHSNRVADYSLKIARATGKSEDECEKVYFAALLHDVGKIGIPNSIINKNGRLTDEEFAAIKQHPVMGGQILSSIKGSPWLSFGARFHHERFGGGGYPEGIKGEEIPEIARIIAVADAYDAMASNRSYRNAIPQHIVREELVKGMGTQFDPEFAKAMIHLIDLDTEYLMQESKTGSAAASTESLRCDEIYKDCTKGIAITNAKTRISLFSHPDEGVPVEESLPCLILFDSLDGEVHPGEEENKDIRYLEYARIRIDGDILEDNVRKTEKKDLGDGLGLSYTGYGAKDVDKRYEIEAVRIRDHAMLKITDEKKATQIILALPDASRFLYISLGGERCFIHNIQVENDEKKADPGFIPRIAEEISFIKDCPVGDIPNVEIDNWCTEASRGVAVTGNMTLSFHSMSLPTARLVWHCPYIKIFSSDNGEVNGHGYREYMLLRIDGENWESDEHVKNKVQVETLEGFKGWDYWMAENKKGIDCTVKIARKGTRIIMDTENMGIRIQSISDIRDNVKQIYVALTGDQCAISDIHIRS